MKKRVGLLTLALTLIMSFTAFAGDWYQKDGEWYYTDTSNPWVKYGEDWYYIDGTGKMMTNYITPDGYYISFSGRMVNQASYDNWEKNSVEFRKTNLVLKYIEMGDSNVLQKFNTGSYGAGINADTLGIFDGRIDSFKKALENDTYNGFNQRDTYNLVKTTLEPIAKEAAKLPEMDRAQYLYDKTCELMDYGYPDDTKLWNERSLAGAILARKGFCLEYTLVYNRLCNLAGLDAYTETCLLHDHTWSIVYVNGEKYYADTSSWDQIGARDRRVVKNRYWCDHDLYKE